MAEPAGEQRPGPGSVRPATRDDVAELAAVLARAFQDDPVISWILPDAGARVRRLPAFYAAQLRTWFVEHAETRVCCRDGRVVAGALWHRPGSPEPPPLVQLRQLPATLRLAGRRVGRLLAVSGATARTRPARPHWYLAELATDPGHQRTGLGDQLLRAQLGRCDDDRAPAYLEAAERAVGYYERYGFAVTEALPIPSGHTLYGMWRPGAHHRRPGPGGGER